MGKECREDGKVIYSNWMFMELVLCLDNSNISATYALSSAYVVQCTMIE